MAAGAVLQVPIGQGTDRALAGPGLPAASASSGGR